MEELLARHRKEGRDVQARVTQLKKASSKKTRRAVNAECDALERALRERHAGEVATVEGSGTAAMASEGEEEGDSPADAVEDLARDLENAHVEAPAPTPAPAAPAAQKKANRQKARLARRAAEQESQAAQAAAEAASLPDRRGQERARMAEAFEARGLREKEIRPDGHCLYSAVAEGLEGLGISLEGEGGGGYQAVRRAAAEYMRKEPEAFEAFLEEPLEAYTRKITDTAEWGGQLELVALARAYGVGVSVLQGDGHVERIAGGGDVGEEKEVWLAYYRHGFGLGEHYNALRKEAS
ncbi:MAG: hypothetical protein M1832_001545 [Thelocarpon impressellum]|nr:MAG: hypothetical protein M1832_001545 [Thelocarpon impressellum]